MFVILSCNFCVNLNICNYNFLLSSWNLMVASSFNSSILRVDSQTSPRCCYITSQLLHFHMSSCNSGWIGGLSSWQFWFLLHNMLYLFFMLTWRLIIHTYRLTLFILPDNPSALAVLTKTSSIISNQIHYKLALSLVTLCVLFFFMIMTLKFYLSRLSHFPNLRPNSLCLTWMVFYNLLSYPLPMLLLKNRCVTILNSLIYQIY